MSNGRGLRTVFSLLAFTSTSVLATDWDTLSDVTAYGLVGVSLATPVIKNDWDGLHMAGFSVVSSTAVSELTKHLVSEQRPDGSGDDSFPSNHATMAFASATSLYKRYGWEYGLPAYGVAALTAYGRVEADKHHWKDVAAGALLGSIAGWYFTEAFDNGVQLSPWASADSAGIALSYNW